MTKQSSVDILNSLRHAAEKYLNIYRGLPDCTDNDGEHYQSKHAADTETQLRITIDAAKIKEYQSAQGLPVNARVDIHVVLDAYFSLNTNLVYDPDLDVTIGEIAEKWGHKL